MKRAIVAALIISVTADASAQSVLIVRDSHSWTGADAFGVALFLVFVLAAVFYLLDRLERNLDLDSEELVELKELAQTPSVANLIRTALQKRGRVCVADLEKARAEVLYQEWVRADKSLKASVQFVGGNK